MWAAVCDTHTVLWFLAGNPRLSITAKQFIEQAAKNRQQIGISSISLVELVYLVEKGRISPTEYTQLRNILHDPENIMKEITVTHLIAEAVTKVDVAKVPDMPDRIIAATGLYLNVPVISRDAKIQVSGIQTIW